MKKYILFLAVILVMVISLVTGCKGSKEEAAETINNQEDAVAIIGGADGPTAVYTTTKTEDDESDSEDIEVDEETDEDKPQEPEVNEEDEHIGQAINPLTGLWIDEEVVERRPIGVMINNLEKAMPQSGIAQADIIYETLVEGGITRLFAIFKDFDAEKIGPVRSSRHYYLDFAFDHDAIYVHYGQSIYAADAFTKLNSPRLNGLSGYEDIMCYQDPKRKRPHSTYTSYEGLLAGWDYKGYRQESKEDFEQKLVFSEEEFDLDSDIDASFVKLDFSHSQKPWFEYDDESKVYYRYQFNGPQIDGETDEHLSFKNIIVQCADMWVIPGDKDLCLDMTLITSGSGYYITNGKAQKITWKKTSHYAPTTYYDENGEKLILNPGKTWIAVYPKNRKNNIIME